MEMGGAGDSTSQGDQARSEEWTGGVKKHHCSHSKKWEPQSATPFPLLEYQGRWEAAHQLYWHAGEQMLATHQTAALRLKACDPKMNLEALMSLNNQVLLMIVEYHLTCASQGTHRVTPILLEVAD